MFIGEREREIEGVTYDTVDRVGRIQNKKVLSCHFPMGHQAILEGAHMDIT